jgi:hypothetical protein
MIAFVLSNRLAGMIIEGAKKPARSMGKRRCLACATCKILKVNLSSSMAWQMLRDAAQG